MRSTTQLVEIGQAEAETIKGLSLEDNRGDAWLVKEILKEAGSKRGGKL
jgi:hypothetical protein